MCQWVWSHFCLCRSLMGFQFCLLLGSINRNEMCEIPVWDGVKMYRVVNLSFPRSETRRRFLKSPAEHLAQICPRVLTPARNKVEFYHSRETNVYSHSSFIQVKWKCSKERIYHLQDQLINLVADQFLHSSNT